MPTFVDALHKELDRLKREREGALRKKSEVIARIDAHVALIDERIELGTRLADAYSRTYAQPLRAKLPVINEPRALPPPPQRARPDTVEDLRRLTWEQVRATEIPLTLNNHRLRPNSKKGQVIRAAKAFLLEHDFGFRSEIFKSLTSLGILKETKSEERNLSVTLSEAKDIFRSYRPPKHSPGWYLLEMYPDDEMEDGTKKK